MPLSALRRKASASGSTTSRSICWRSSPPRTRPNRSGSISAGGCARRSVKRRTTDVDPVIFQGGIYKHEQMIELVEDLGGYILQKNLLQLDVIAVMLVPNADLPL